MPKLKKYVLKPLILFGALNWGLIGLFNWNLVSAIFGGNFVLCRIIYIIIGLAAATCIAMMAMPRKEK